MENEDDSRVGSVADDDAGNTSNIPFTHETSRTSHDNTVI